MEKVCVGSNNSLYSLTIFVVVAYRIRLTYALNEMGRYDNHLLQNC